MKTLKYAAAAAVGAVVLPAVAYIGDRVDYVGGAIAAVPLIDLLPLLFIGTRESARSTLVGDFIGQTGAVSGIFLAFALLHFTNLTVGLIIALAIVTAIVLNTVAYLVLRASVGG